MTSSLSSILVLMLICRWCSNTNGIPYQENLESSGLEVQLDPAPDPAGGFCQRHKNPAGLGFVGTKYDLLKGNPEGRDSLGGVDPGFDKTKKIFQLTVEDGDEVPIQICYEERNSCSTTKTSKIFGGTKRYQDKLNVDVSAEGKLLACSGDQICSVYVVVNFLSRVIFVFPLFFGMVMFANEVETKEKEKLPTIKN